MSLLLSPTQRERWAAPVAGCRLCTGEGGISGTVFRLLKSCPDFPRLEQQGSCLHTRGRFEHAFAEALLGLVTGGCVDAACTGGLALPAQPWLPGPTELPSALTLSWHMPTAPEWCAGLWTLCHHHHAQPSPALQDVAQQMLWQRS